jgi:hypothetical protein
MSNTVNWAIVPLTITAKTSPRPFYGMLVTRKGVEYLAVKESRKGELSLAYYGKDKAEFNFGRRTRGAAQGEIDVSLLSGRFEPVAFALTLAGEGVTAMIGHKAQTFKARVVFGGEAGAAEAPAAAPTMADLMKGLATAAAPPAPEPVAAPAPEALPSLEQVEASMAEIKADMAKIETAIAAVEAAGMPIGALRSRRIDLEHALMNLTAKREEVLAQAAAELEADAVEAFVLTPAAIAACWGDADGLMALAKQAGLDVGRTRSAAGLGGMLMAALQ